MLKFQAKKLTLPCPAHLNCHAYPIQRLWSVCINNFYLICSLTVVILQSSKELKDSIEVIVRIEFSPTDHICDNNGQLWSDGDY